MTGAPRRVIVVLTLAGAIPFWGLPLLAWAWPGSGAALEAARLGYGVVILSFMAGTHWGLALAQGALAPRLAAAMAAVSVVPVLAVWAVAALAPAALGVVLPVAFLAHPLMDLWIRHRLGLPGWYWHLRLLVTGLVVTGLVIPGLLFAAPLSPPPLSPPPLTPVTP